MFENGSLTVTLPELSAFQWYHAFWITGIYGFVTHMKSLPAIHRYNKKHDGRWVLCSAELFIILLGRLTIALPLRILIGVAGVVWIFFSFVSTGVPAIKNDALKRAWQWHSKPNQLVDLFSFFG